MPGQPKKVAVIIRWLYEWGGSKAGFYCTLCSYFVLRQSKLKLTDLLVIGKDPYSSPRELIPKHIWSMCSCPTREVCMMSQKNVCVGGYIFSSSFQVSSNLFLNMASLVFCLIDSSIALRYSTATWSKQQFKPFNIWFTVFTCIMANSISWYWISLFTHPLFQSLFRDPPNKICEEFIAYKDKGWEGAVP